MSGNGQVTRLNVRKALSDVRECSGGLLEYPGVVGRPSRMTGSGREALPDVREWSGGPSECHGMVGRSFRMIGSGREAFRMSGNSLEASR